MVQKNIKKNKLVLKENRTRSKAKGEVRWIIAVTLTSFAVSGLLLYIFSIIVSDIKITASVVFVLIIVFLGIIADMVGVAVTAADETQFHSMAAKRIRGSRRSITLIRHAHKVSSLLNDVVGDICGVISGSVTAMIVLYIVVDRNEIDSTILSIVFSGLVAALTIGGKAAGKTIAVKNSNNIVYRTAFILTFISPEKWRKSNRRNGE